MGPTSRAVTVIGGIVSSHESIMPHLVGSLEGLLVGFHSLLVDLIAFLLAVGNHLVHFHVHLVDVTYHLLIDSHCSGNIPLDISETLQQRGSILAMQLKGYGLIFLHECCKEFLVGRKDRL